MVPLRQATLSFQNGGQVLSVLVANGDLVQALQALALRQAHVDELGVHGLDVGQHQQLLDAGVIAHIAVQAGVGITPLPGGLAEQGDIEQVGFVGIDERCMGLGECRRQERFLDRVRMDAVIDLCQSALEVPPKLEAVVLNLLEAAKFFDQIDFELGADPHTKFEGDVGMRKRAPIPPSGSFEANGVGFFNPLFNADLVAIQASLAFNCGEFAIIKSWVVHALSNS